jgi:hypothetical protein
MVQHFRKLYSTILIMDRLIQHFMVVRKFNNIFWSADTWFKFFLYNWFNNQHNLIYEDHILIYERVGIWYMLWNLFCYSTHLKHCKPYKKKKYCGSYIGSLTIYSLCFKERRTPGPSQWMKLTGLKSSAVTYPPVPSPLSLPCSQSFRLSPRVPPFFPVGVLTGGKRGREPP